MRHCSRSWRAITSGWPCRERRRRARRGGAQAGSPDDRAAQRAARGAPRRPDPLRVPAHRPVHAAVPAAHELPAQRVLRDAVRRDGLRRLLHRALLRAPAALPPVRARVADRDRQHAADRRPRLPGGGDRRRVPAHLGRPLRRRQGVGLLGRGVGADRLAVVRAPAHPSLPRLVVRSLSSAAGPFTGWRPGGPKGYLGPAIMDRRMRRLLILGATGSIGLQALDVVGRARDEFELVGLSAERSHESLVALAAEHGVDRIALGGGDAAARAAEAWTEGEVLAGPEGLVRLVADSGSDLVLNAIVGSAGLGPTVVALTEGIDVALANKESLVVGGDLVMPLAEATGAQLIPVDSEHSALHQLIAGEAAGAVDRLVITASGGPFRGRSRAELEDVSVEEALKHPTWSMGGKITIDSATLMNKGLEVIEAHHLFGTPYDRIDVVVHPQSIVHGMVQLCDGASLAHLGHPDMRVPIAYALHHPERVDVPVPALDLAQVGSLTFEPPDLEAFPALGLAFAAARAGGTAPCVLNAANEVAVHAFLGERLGFMGIPAVIEGTLEQLPARTVHSFESLYQADAEARRIAGELVAQEALA